MLYILDQDYSEMVDGQKEPAGNKDNLIFKLKQRIQERDRALEVHKHTFTKHTVLLLLFKLQSTILAL